MPNSSAGLVVQFLSDQPGCDDVLQCGNGVSGRMQLVAPRIGGAVSNGIVAAGAIRRLQPKQDWLGL